MIVVYILRLLRKDGHIPKARTSQPSGLFPQSPNRGLEDDLRTRPMADDPPALRPLTRQTERDTGAIEAAYRRMRVL